MEQRQIELCKIIGAVLRGEAFKPNCENADNFIMLSNQYDMLNIIYSCIMEQLSEKALMFCTSTIMKSALLEENRQYEFKRICDYAEKNNIFILALKGIYTRTIYPDSSFRKMTDVDLFYNRKQEKQVNQMMKSLGFRDAGYSMKHITWYNSTSNVTVEMHNSLFPEFGLGKTFFSDLFKRTIPLDGYKNIFRMCDNDNYIYTLFHFYGHYCYSSVRLRQLTDLYVMQLYCDLSFGRIEREIKLLDLYDFYVQVKSITNKLFVSGEVLSENEEKFADVFFGNTVSPEKEEEDSRKLFRILKTMFPKPEKIYVFYPFIYRHKWLLPFGYIKRIFQCLKSDKIYVKKKID